MATVSSSAELGDRIRQARVASGRSQQALADAMQIDRSALARIEQGDRKVSTLELLSISEALELPLSWFVTRSPEAITSRRGQIGEDAGSSDRGRFQADAALELHLRDAEFLRHAGVLSPVSGLPAGDVGDAAGARRLARAVRKFVGIPENPLPGMAEVAERVGLYVLPTPLAGDGASLTPEPGFGIAVIDCGRPSGRRRTTAAHELGHHVLGDEYQSDIGVSASREQREALIDEFAQEFLLPMEVLSSRYEILDGTSRARLVRIAADFRVSWQVACLAAKQALGVDTPELRAAPTRSEFLEVCGQAPAEDLRPGEVGPAWTRGVVRMQRDGLISRTRAIEMLHGALSEDDFGPEPDPAP